MPSSVSWQRYDDEFNVSAILTEAARACVAARPTEVKDYFSRYFREVAGGTSVKEIRYDEILCKTGGAAVTFTIELSAGPEASVTTGDLFAASSGTGVNVERSSPLVQDPTLNTNDLNSPLNLEDISAKVVAQLLQRGAVEPQQAWDAVLRKALDVGRATPLMMWALSILAALVAAKQRAVPLYQYIASLVECPRASAEMRATASSMHAPDQVRSPTSAVPIMSIDGLPSHYVIPQLLVTFLVCSARADAPETAGHLFFSHVYVAIDVLHREADELSGETSAESAYVDAVELFRQMRKVQRAAGKFLSAHPSSAQVGTDGVLRWDGAPNLVDVVKAVSDALAAAQLQVGVDVCVGISLGASTMHAAAADVTVNTNRDTPGSSPVLYHLFCGEPPVTGDQLSEYVKEQLDDCAPKVLQFLEDTHVAGDTVARQRLQMALQEKVVLGDVLTGDDVVATTAFVTPSSSPCIASSSSGAFPNAVVNLCRCGTVDAAVEVLCTARENAGRSLSVVTDYNAGDAPTAAHAVDIAIASGAAYLVVCAGIFSDHTAATTSRLAARTAELAQLQRIAPRPSPTHFHRLDWPPLPPGDVAPIRRKGDKRKKEVGKSNNKKK